MSFEHYESWIITFGQFANYFLDAGLLRHTAGKPRGILLPILINGLSRIYYKVKRFEGSVTRVFLIKSIASTGTS